MKPNIGNRDFVDVSDLNMNSDININNEKVSPSKGAVKNGRTKKAYKLVY